MEIALVVDLEGVGLVLGEVGGVALEGVLDGHCGGVGRWSMDMVMSFAYLAECVALRLVEGV